MLCPFHSRARPSAVPLESPGLENIPQFPGNRAEVGQSYDGRKAVSATLSLLKWGGAIFRPRSSKVSVQKVLLCAFYCRPRTSRVSLESPGTWKYPPNSGKFNRSWSKSRRAYGGLGYSLRLKVKWGNISAQKLKTESFKKFCMCPFHCITRPSRLSLA